MPGLAAEVGGAVTKRAVMRALVYAFGSAILLLVLYFLVPWDSVEGAGAVAELIIGLAIFVGALAWELRRILLSENPGLRAMEATAVAIPLLLVVFAAVHLGVSSSDPDAYSEPLTHISALYFVVTTFATVGYGDIAPRTDLARTISMIQMVVDLVAIGVVAKLLFGAARLRLDRSRNLDHAHHPEVLVVEDVAVVDGTAAEPPQGNT